MRDATGRSSIHRKKRVARRNQEPRSRESERERDGTGARGADRYDTPSRAPLAYRLAYVHVRVHVHTHTPRLSGINAPGTQHAIIIMKNDVCLFRCQRKIALAPETRAIITQLHCCAVSLFISHFRMANELPVR